MGPTWQEEELHPVVGNIDEFGYLIVATYDGTIVQAVYRLPRLHGA